MFNERKFFFNYLLTFPRTVNIHVEYHKVTTSEKYACIISNKTGIAFLFMTASKSFMYK